MVPLTNPVLPAKCLIREMREPEAEIERRLKPLDAIMREDVRAPMAGEV
jgi:hypothetical protein